MVDVAFLDKAGYWLNLAYIATVCLTLMLSVAIVFLSNHRSALRDAELRRVQAESDERIATANQRSAEADKRAAASNAAAAQAQSEAASATLAQAQLRKENLQLSVELERERRLRSEVEEKARLQPAPPEIAPQAAQPRVLTAEHEALLFSAMGRFSNRQVTIVELADPEAGALARQIASVLEKAQWKVFISRVGALAPPQLGIIGSHSPGDTAASEFITTLRSFNLIVYERTENLDRFQIIVGLRPPG